MVASKTQGPLDGRVERPVQHHIVHPWGLNQLRKLHVPQRPEPGDCRVPEGRDGYAAAGLKRMPRRWAGRRGGDAGGEVVPRPRLGWAPRGLWPPSQAPGKPGLDRGWARPGVAPSPLCSPRPRTRAERTLRDRPSRHRRQLRTRPRGGQAEGTRRRPTQGHFPRPRRYGLLAEVATRSRSLKQLRAEAAGSKLGRQGSPIRKSVPA